MTQLTPIAWWLSFVGEVFLVAGAMIALVFGLALFGISGLSGRRKPHPKGRMM